MDAEEGEEAQQQGGQEQALAGEEGLFNALLQAMNEEDEGEEEDVDEEDEMEHGEADAESGPEDAEPEETASDPILDKGVKQYGCEHYRRRAMIVAPCCDKPFWCRHCHNMQANDNEVDPKKRHVLDRKAVREVVCGLCGLRQLKARSCAGCGVAFGRYCCLLCSFFDDDLSKECFHCTDCGICRVGGRQNFFHCRTCNCCYALSLRDSHVCIENSMHHNCPVCCEYLFDSIKPINIMPCGHTIHQECLRSLAEHSTYTCPVCMKSIMSNQAMERVWDSLDQAVQATPMPNEYSNVRVPILCNDCSQRATAPFHVLGHKCPGCGSYNTRRT